MRIRGFWMGLVVAAAVAVCSRATAQAFNIDIDYQTDPPLGGGAPSDAFGAGAGQPGRWNALNWGDRGPRQLFDLAGNLQTTTVSLSPGASGGGGYNNALNTGDYALLLNDIVDVGPAGAGGTLTYYFEHLASGAYDIYTYAVSPQSGAHPHVPVTVTEAQNPTETVTGPMPGNSFSRGITHSIHRVVLAEGGSFHIAVVQPPLQETNFQLNGFQIVPVPEVSPGLTFAIGILLFSSMRPRHPTATDSS